MHRLTLATLVLCNAWLVAPGCGERQDAEPPRASAEQPPARVFATGRVEGWREADVACRISGRVARFLHGEGAEVDEGVPVVQLEDRDLAARVREAEARAKEARLALARTRELGRDRFVSVSEIDRVDALHAASAAALDEARAVLEYATVRAPFRGTIVRKFKEVGEAVSINAGPDPLFRIADLSRLKVTAEVPENDIAAVRPGQRGEVTTDAYPGTGFPATVARVGLAAGRKRLRSDDPRERLDEKVVEVELHLAGDARLRSGMTVDVAIEASHAGSTESDPAPAALLGQ